MAFDKAVREARKKLKREEKRRKKKKKREAAKSPVTQETSVPRNSDDGNQ